MKFILRFFRVLCVLGLSIAAGQAAAPATHKESGARLTIELRDGSRVVGQSVAGQFKFHSALLGDLKLEVKDIHSVECTSSNSVKLTTASGDALTVSFADSDIAVKTSFGKVELAVNSIRKFTVTTISSGKIDSGLVAHFAFDGSADDSSGNGLNGSGHRITYATGIAGQAAVFNQIGDYISVPDSAALDLTGSLTLTLWFKFEVGGTEGPRMICKGGSYGIATEGTGVSRRLFFGCTAGEVFGGLACAGQWMHAAGVYDGTAVKLYLNGVLVGQEPASGPLKVTSYDLNIGRNSENGSDLYQGAIDEVRIYNRALSAEEIKAICTEDNHGEPLPSPSPARTRFSRGGIRPTFE